MGSTRTIERTSAFAASPHAVFVAVCSPETAPLIDPAVREWTPDRRPIGVGTRFTIRARLGVLPIRGMSEVVTWDPPRLAEFRSVKPTWPFRMTARHAFEPGPDGGTAYTWSISFHEVNRVGRPIIALAARLFDRAQSAQAEALRRYLDGRSEDAPLPQL